MCTEKHVSNGRGDGVHVLPHLESFFLSSVSHQLDQPLSHQRAAITRGRIFAVCSVIAVAVIEHSPETVHKCVVCDKGG